MLAESQKEELYVLLEQLSSAVIASSVSTEKFESHIDDVKSAFNSSLVRLRRSRNYIVSATRAFPTELLVLCFEFLDSLYDRVSATCVSHKWRTAALGCPTLWNRVEMDIRSSSDLALMQFLLRRGSELPMYIRLIDYYSPKDDDSLWLESIYNISNPVASLFVINSTPLSLLRLHARYETTLSDLQCREFSFDGLTEPFRYVTTLTIQVIGDVRDLFRIFPNVTCMELIGKEVTLPSDPFPRGLTHLTMTYIPGLSEYLAQRKEHDLERLEIVGNKELLLPALEHVNFPIKALHMVPSNLYIHSFESVNKTIVKTGEDDNVTADVLLIHAHILRPNIGTLRILTMFGNIRLLAAAGLDLPVLEKLNLIEPFTEITYDMDSLPAPSNSLQLPKLRKICLSIKDQHSAASGDFIQDMLSSLAPTEMTCQVEISFLILREDGPPDWQDDALLITGLQNVDRGFKKWCLTPSEIPRRSEYDS